MEGVTLQRRQKEDVAQEHGNAYTYRAPVVEMPAAEPLEEIQRHHHQACDVEQVKHQLGP